VDIGDLRLLALDTVTPGKSRAACAPSALHGWKMSWHPPKAGGDCHAPSAIQTLIGHMDRIGLLQGAPELEAIVSRHPNVERVICGHLHRSIQVAFGARSP
jgi:hypothetical protein